MQRGGPLPVGVEVVIPDAQGRIKGAGNSPPWSTGPPASGVNPPCGDLASRMAKGDWPVMAALVRSIFDQPDRDVS